MANDLASRLDRMFNPRTMAIVGDKHASGFMWLRNNQTFTGKLYSVQIDEREIPGIEQLGVPNYKSLLDIPGEIDYVVVAVPRQIAPRIVKDCIAKGVAGCTLFTSGFAETEEEEGIHLQRTITEMAREAKLPLIGPNCMGVHNPKLGVRHSVDQPYGPDAGGSVGFISQSGTHAGFFTQCAPEQGVRVSKSVSFGNAVVLDVADYLDYLANDPETEVIAMYLEGVRDGRRFVDVLRKTTARKPVVVWKGGQSEAGQRAIYSHTASLAAPTAVWNAIMRQAGAITADNIDETLDAVQALVLAKPGTKKAAALIAMTGGQSVSITDAFAKYGIDVPRLSQTSYDKLAEFFNIIGGSYRNPLDAGGTIGGGIGLGNLEKVLNILDEDDNVGVIAIELSIGFQARRWQNHPDRFTAMLDAICAFRDRSAKPLVTIMHPAHLEALAIDVRHQVQARGLPAFASFERAARALSKVLDYHRYRAGLD